MGSGRPRWGRCQRLLEVQVALAALKLLLLATGCVDTPAPEVPKTISPSQPSWVALANPFVGAIGVLLGWERVTAHLRMRIRVFCRDSIDRWALGPCLATRRSRSHGIRRSNQTSSSERPNLLEFLSAFMYNRGVGSGYSTLFESPVLGHNTFPEMFVAGDIPSEACHPAA